MLPKANRIRLARDFERVFSEKKSLNAAFVRIKVIATGLPVTRVGIITSSKISKRAVVRNRLRRRIRDIAARKLPSLPPGFDMVILCSPAAAQADFKALAEDIGSSLDRLFKRF